MQKIVNVFFVNRLEKKIYQIQVDHHLLFLIKKYHFNAKFCFAIRRNCILVF